MQITLKAKTDAEMDSRAHSPIIRSVRNEKSPKKFKFTMQLKYNNDCDFQ